MKPVLPRCSKEHDYSVERPRLKFSDGGRYLRVQFGLSPSAQWNSEVFGRRAEGRGQCKGFSFGSRRRLLDRLNSVSVAAELPAFVTMTLPDDVFRDNVSEFAKEAKRWLDVWVKRLSRVEPNACGFWRIEWKARKSGNYEGKLFPHFHALIWGLPKRLLGEREDKHVRGLTHEVWEHYVRTPDNQLSLELLNLWSRPQGSTKDAQPLDDGEWSVDIGPTASLPAMGFRGRPKFIARCQRLHDDVWISECSTAEKDQVRARNMSFQDWASLAWYHVVGSHNTDHLTAGVRVEHVRSWGGVMSYAAKYLGKEGDDFLTEIRFGRSWGVFNRAAVPWAKMVELELDTDMGIRLRRIARRYLEHRTGKKKNRPYGVTLYCDVEQFRKLWERPPPDPF